MPRFRPLPAMTWATSSRSPRFPTRRRARSGAPPTQSLRQGLLCEALVAHNAAALADDLRPAAADAVRLRTGASAS